MKDRQRYNILIGDGDKAECDALADLLENEEYSVESVNHGTGMLEILKQRFFNVVIADITMPEVKGFDLLRLIKEKHPDTLVLFITNCGKVEEAVAAIKKGATDYIVKPFDSYAFKTVIRQAIEQQISQNEKLEKQISMKFDGLIGRDKEMRRIMRLINVIAKSDITVLVTGESGTGKSLFARAIHHNSARKDNAFIEVPCGAIPEGLLESEMFGYSKGAFTGAIEDKPGLFEIAEGGTVLLDEIYSAPSTLQVKLLRVLQEKKFEKVGSHNPITANVRVIVSTNSDLKSEVKKGNFRQDLYYRINVMHIKIPPLRERKCDIKLLAKYFLDKYSLRYGKENLIISNETMYLLEHYSWPGNVRELENVMQRAVITAIGNNIVVDDITSHESGYTPKSGNVAVLSLKKAMEKPEKEFIEHTLKYFNGNKNKTAEVLKLNRTTLYKKMKKYNL